MKRVAIIGAGVLGTHIAHYILQDSHLRLAGFYDDYQEKGTVVNKGVVLGAINNIEFDFKKNVFDQLLIGVGYNHLYVRQKLFEKFTPNIPFATYVHPSAYVDSSVTLGEGVVVFPGCVLDKDVKVGNNVLFNIGCFIAHDSQVADNCFFGPGVVSAGFVSIGMHCFLGINTSIINNIDICDKVRTGGGTVVVSDIKEPGLYIGTPAKLLKTL